MNPVQPHRLTCDELLAITDYTEDARLLDGMLRQINCLPSVPVNNATEANMQFCALSATANVGAIAGEAVSTEHMQGGALVARRDLVVRLAYEITEQGNEYAEDVQRVQGIYSPLIPGSEVCTRMVKWQKVAKLAEAPAEAGFSGGSAAPWSSVNNCTDGGTRRWLKLELNQRGFAGTDEEINILKRRGALKFGQSALIYREGRLQEKWNNPKDEQWPGWQ